MAVREDVLQAMEAERLALRRVPQVIRTLMRYLDLSEENVAAAFGVKRQTINNRLNGRTAISLPEAKGWAIFFGIPQELLFGSPENALRWLLDHPDQAKALVEWASKAKGDYLRFAAA